MKENKASQLIDDALNLLIESIEQGHSEALKQYLEAMSRFHKYSFHNILLIAFQNEHATHVAGFHAWRKLNRFVKRGEKGIAIIAPMVYKKEDSSESDETEQNIRGFRAVYVFDISQTDGDELPELGKVNGDPQELSDSLNEFITKCEITLEYSDDMSEYGRSSGGKITIKFGLSEAEDFAVRVHELAHEMLHHTKGEKLSKKQKETEAEAVSYVVCHAIGLNTNSAFQDYIQLYKGDKETLLKSLERIQKTAGRILGGLLMWDNALL